MAGIGHNGPPPEETGDDRANNWFAVSRDIFDHPIVGIHNRPFTETEAWLWLVSRATYETRRAMNKGTVIVLDPGDLMAAHSYLAERWKWSVDKVRWYLKRLQAEAMISRAVNKSTNRNTNQIQIISICNYSRYQIIREAEHQANSQANTKPTPSQHQEDNTLTIKHYTPLTPQGGDRASQNRTAARQAFTEWRECAKRCGLTVPRETSFETFGRKIAARMFEHADAPKGVDEMLAVWRTAIAMVERSKFLRGMSDAKFRADLKFVCQRESFAKLIEGGYGNGAHAAAPVPVSRTVADIAAEQARLQREAEEMGYVFTPGDM